MSAAAPGVPGWIDLGSPDLDATRSFYTQLFGWTAHTGGPEFGGYTIFNLGDDPVAGAGPLFSPDQPTVWTTYVITESADETAAKVEANGGKVLMAPGDVGENGRMGMFMDSGGAVFAVWQPGTMPGATVFNTAGALSWNELLTRDAAGAKSFYEGVFGWGHDDSDNGGVTYTSWMLNDAPVGGMMQMDSDNFPAELPAHWMVYFAVEDTDATVAKCTELGGSVAVPPTDIPQGRFAVLMDPHGAAFSVIKLTM
ncbi:VOC family protein [Kutzneria sp. CA-103260]|uniref:VOC family protein n=1 Tax=Kutzneria sp. CA-103260 TaxID=2802641 RepID=UPI001BA4C531|nr:VOC family protein [Kutzneria sp. CA-103260]QUQ62962.1 VOC family protein [Kutzneria sp. CA-103260]